MKKNALIDHFKEILHIETAIPRDVVVGIDFGGSTLKITQISKKRSIPTLDTYGEIALGPYLDTEEGSVVSINRDAYTSALRDLARDAGVTAQSAAIALPYGATFTVVLTVDSLDHAEITARVPILIKNLIPVRLQDVSIDWFPFATDEQTKKTMVVAVAVYNNTMNQIREVATRAGFSVLSTELEYFSAMRVSSVKTPSKIILDMGATSGKIYFVVNGTLVGIHSIGILGGENLTKTLARSQKISFSDAEKHKQEKSPLSDDIHAIIQKGAEELQALIHANSHAEILQSAPCIVIGGSARFTDIETILHDTLSKDIVRGEPFTMVAYPRFLHDILRHIGGAYTPSVSVALAAVTAKV